MRTAFPCVLLLAVMATSGFAQTVNDVERKVNRYLEAIQDSHDAMEDDSLEAANAALHRYLVRTLPKVPGSLASNIRVDANMTVATSNDHKLRIWSWDMLTGGSMVFYDQLVEYQTQHGPRAQSLNTIDTTHDGGDNQARCDTIFTILCDNGSTIYLPVQYSIASHRDISQSITAVRIDHDSIRVNVPFFRTTKKLLGSIGYSYDFFEGFDEKRNREAPGIHMSENGKTLFIPLVKGRKKTWKSLRYVFDGKEFVFQKSPN